MSIEVERRGKTEPYTISSSIKSSEAIKAENGNPSCHRILLEDKTEIRFPRIAKIIIDPIRKGDEIKITYPREVNLNEGEIIAFAGQASMSVTRKGKHILDLPISKNYVLKPL